MQRALDLSLSAEKVAGSEAMMENSDTLICSLYIFPQYLLLFIDR